MPQCEMCGKEVPSLTAVRIEGAEIDVCDDCADFGTEVRTESTSQSTKYSTDSGAAGSSSTSGTPSTGSSSTESRGHDMFDEMDEIVQDYDQRIRSARESAGLSQEELANQLNEKSSLIRKLEHGDSLPSDSVQTKLERKLGISLSESAEMDDSDWDGGSSSGSYTLGDVVRRK
ncbi:multiprotein bridging factor aMBF1 [Halocatena salina]|uniref:Multiprotein bridging factor aMBF1 n=1 Tax=Halocatena salina TaxID=2934340 RepID=A0A8U0A541_9EURY|nr:multiprotein bridging factor aMBF1 [Halocatena salina]UPM43027.1 multiprotein bridging factor aMBF1 [Halocatena salina]